MFFINKISNYRSFVLFCVFSFSQESYLVSRTNLTLLRLAVQLFVCTCSYLFARAVLVIDCVKVAHAFSKSYINPHVLQ